MAGKKRQVRYSPETLRLALSLWLRTSKGYEEFKTTNKDIYLPSGRHLQSIKQASASKSGGDPAIYRRAAAKYFLAHEDRIHDEKKMKNF